MRVSPDARLQWLAVALAVGSSILNRPVAEHTLAFGEVGLTGEVRGVVQATARLVEAHRLGFSRVIIPKDNMKSVEAPAGLEVRPVSDIGQAFVEAHLQ